MPKTGRPTVEITLSAAERRQLESWGAASFECAGVGVALSDRAGLLSTVSGNCA